MLTYPEISPYLFEIGPFQPRWYGLMYVIGFMSAYYLLLFQVKERELGIKIELIQDLFFYVILGLILGGRVGYVLFYNFSQYLQEPWEILAVWHGGMSFHGGLIGCLVAGILFGYKNKLNFWVLADLTAVTVPIGLGFGRIGNFINGELYGRPTQMPWGMVFPRTDGLPRHPSQLYEAFLEGIVLFAVLWLIRKRVLIKGGLLGVFLILYGSFRFFVEFFREPDTQLGLFLSAISMGQILSVFMIFAGLFILYRRRRHLYCPKTS